MEYTMKMIHIECVLNNDSTAVRP